MTFIDLRTDRWRPIETAPTNEVVLGHHDGHVGKAILLATDEWMNIEEDEGSFFIPRPTQWQPVPTSLVSGATE